MVRVLNFRLLVSGMKVPQRSIVSSYWWRNYAREVFSIFFRSRIKILGPQYFSRVLLVTKAFSHQLRSEHCCFVLHLYTCCRSGWHQEIPGACAQIRKLVQIFFAHLQNFAFHNFILSHLHFKKLLAVARSHQLVHFFWFVPTSELRIYYPITFIAFSLRNRGILAINRTKWLKNCFKWRIASLTKPEFISAWNPKKLMRPKRKQWQDRRAYYICKGS